MNQVLFLLGSNLGDRLAHIEGACSAIESCIGAIVSKSQVYETEAWGNTSLAGFLNRALLVQTELKPLALLDQILDIEKRMGRIRNEKWEARIIDIDILIYNTEIIKEERLEIPHPLMHLRKFCLIPAIELLPLYIHPVSMNSLSDLLLACNDSLSVKPFVK